MSITVAVFVSYVVGSIVTGFMAYKRGVIRGSSVTIDVMIAKKMVKTRRRSDGEIELLPLDHTDTTVF